MRVRRSLLGGLLPLLCVTGCGPEQGIVEVYWQFEDGSLDRIYPPGWRTSTCGFSSTTGESFDIRVQLTIAHATEACTADPSDPACQVVEPKRFDCLRARGTITAVPPSAQDGDPDPGYLMVVEPVIIPSSSEAFVPISNCIAKPGPRVRRVRPGRIADLEVHQFVVHALAGEGERIDLEACRPEAEDGDTDSGTSEGTGSDSEGDTESSTESDSSGESETDSTG